MTAESLVDSAEVVDIAVLGPQIEDIVATYATDTIVEDGISWQRFSPPSKSYVGVGCDRSGKQWYETTVMMPASAFRYRWQADCINPVQLTIVSIDEQLGDAEEWQLQLLADKLPGIMQNAQEIAARRGSVRSLRASEGRPQAPSLTRQPSLSRQIARAAFHGSQRLFGFAWRAVGE